MHFSALRCAGTTRAQPACSFIERRRFEIARNPTREASVRGTRFIALRLPLRVSAMHPSTTPQPPVSGSDRDPIFARIATVVRVTGLGRTTIYRLMAENKFPAQVRISRRIVGWRWEDLERWSATQQGSTH
jgi:prophage regulatory protein